jgi:hypothetical protein
MLLAQADGVGQMRARRQRALLRAWSSQVGRSVQRGVGSVMCRNRRCAVRRLRCRQVLEERGIALNVKTGRRLCPGWARQDVLTFGMRCP